MNRLRTAILGTGKLGTDLLYKVLDSDLLECTAFVGRNKDSVGLGIAKEKGINTSDEGFEYLKRNGEMFDLIFDVTSAGAHLQHLPIVKKLEKKIVDLTPSDQGHMIVPAINLKDALRFQSLGLISCGGQTSLPMINVLHHNCQDIRSIEVVSCIASNSAGPGTRINLDEYIHRTEAAIRSFADCKNVKAALLLNPAEPEITMKTSIYIEGICEDLPKLEIELGKMVGVVRRYIPGYCLKVGPIVDAGILSLSLQVQGRGDYLPKYAGNLDIINCAAIQVAEAIALNISNPHEQEYAVY